MPLSTAAWPLGNSSSSCTSLKPWEAYPSSARASSSCLAKPSQSRALPCTTLTSVGTSRVVVAGQASFRLMTEIAANQTAPDSNNGNRQQHLNTPGQGAAPGPASASVACDD